MGQHSVSTENLATYPRKVKLYRVRWYIIIVVSTANIVNNFLWATWGPIADSAKFVYNWTDNTIFWITNAGNIAAFLATIFAVSVIDIKGLRWAMVLCTFCLAVSSLSRIVTLTQPAATILITIGQVFNGMATSVTMTIPPAMSETWFHVGERNTATAISCMSAGIGAGMSFLLGPFMVSMPQRNGSTIFLNDTDIGRIKYEIKTLHFTVFGVSGLLFLATLVYFPSKPKTAPSKTATLARYNLKQGFNKLIKKPAMWYIGCIYAIPMGTYGTWSSVLYPITQDLNFTQIEVGWIGFYGNLAGTLAALLMGRLSDKYSRRQKIMLMILDTCALVAFLWFASMCSEIVPRSKALLYCAAITGSMFIGSTGPLFLEITCEIAYPISEGISSGFLSFVLNVAATIYLLITLIPQLDTRAMTWVLCGVLGIAVPCLVMAKVNYQRVEIDDNSKLIDESTVNGRPVEK